SGYPDADKIHSYAKDALAWANEANLIKGMNDGTLSPRGSATREQFATILKRFDDTFSLVYNEPVLRSHYTEPEYPLVENADVYVAVDGSDGNLGTFDAPVASFSRAMERVREIKAERTSGDIVVAFKAGDYGALDVSFSSEDSGTPEQNIIYCAYGDGDVVFNNGVDIPADAFSPISEEEKSTYNFSDAAAKDIKKADISRFIPAGTYDLSYYVFSETNICTVARFPNKYSDGTDQLMEGGYASDENHIRFTNVLMKRHISGYHTLENVKLYGYLTTGWFKDTLSIGAYDPETGDMLITDPENARMGSLRYNEFPWWEYFGSALINASEELDYPGEYWVDPATSVMYVYAPEGAYHFCVEPTMITMKSANNITFRGLSFTNAKERFIDCNVCHDITIDLCRFDCVAGMYGIYFYTHDPDRDFNFTLTRSEFDRAMDCFLGIFGKSTSERVAYATHMNALIDNNSFTNYNLFLNEESAMYISHCDEVKISHNEFINGGRGAVFYGASQNVIMEYNYATNQMINASDGGVFCTWNDLYHRGNVVRYNLIEKVASLGAGGMGLYLDDYDTGTDIYSNLFFDNAGDAVVVHNGRDNLMRDNVLVDPNRIEIGGFNVTRGDGMYGPEGTPGVLTEDDQGVLDSWNGVFEMYDNNPALKAYAMEHWPEIFDLTTDPEQWDDPNFVLARNNTITGNRFISKSGKIAVPKSEYVVKYSTIEDNIGYTVEENPLFVNPTIGDYRIRDGVDFPDIEFEKIGRY
ncbi:MAG: right-handed parallel beta-helix repeat-containing protein, partial [Clostridia bacterium]|nr:right-handed parallel beta-helix repeat-containing protein [Clostridia bacterium]